MLREIWDLRVGEDMLGKMNMKVSRKPIRKKLYCLNHVDVTLNLSVLQAGRRFTCTRSFIQMNKASKRYNVAQ